MEELINKLIKKALKSRDKILDLGAIGLKTLPKIPDGILELNISHNKLSDLSKLPSSLTFLDCSHNKLSSLHDLSYLKKLEKMDCSYNKLSEISELPKSLTELNLNGNLFTKVPKFTPNINYCIFNNPVAKDLYTFSKFNSSLVTNHKFNQTKFSVLKLRKGTVLFKMIKYKEQFYDSFVGYPLGKNYVMGPTVETYFFLQPFNAFPDYGDKTLFYVLTNDVDVILGTEPGFSLTKTDIIENFGQDCYKKKYRTSVDYRYWWGECWDDKFDKEFSNVLGWIATGDSERPCKHPETSHFEKYKDYVSFYSTFGELSRPEIALHPRRVRTQKDIKVPITEFSPDWIKEHESEFNYKIINILEHNQDFDNYKKLMDKYLSKSGCQDLHMTRGSDGLYMVKEYMD